VKAEAHSKKAIGHFGFFRSHHEKGLWSDVLNWMSAYEA
jgi:predicted alpha/beta hydrolase